MFTNWFETKSTKIGFEDVHHAIKNPETHILINTLSTADQDCLIKSTLPSDQEERVINELLAGYQYTTKILIIYGRNSSDSSVEKKQRQLTALGFSQVYVYSGGLFEWVLLQDIYGNDEFPTSRKVLDILRFKPSGLLVKPRLAWS